MIHLRLPMVMMSGLLRPPQASVLATRSLSSGAMALSVLSLIGTHPRPIKPSATQGIQWAALKLSLPGPSVYDGHDTLHR